MAWETENSNTGRNGCFSPDDNRRRLQAKSRKGQGNHDKVIKYKKRMSAQFIIYILTIKNNSSFRAVKD